MTAILASAGGKAQGGSAAEAAGFGDVVVNALPWPATKDVLSNLDNLFYKKTAAQLASDIGFEPIDAGPPTNARMLELLAMLWVWLAFPGGMGREFAFQLLKR